MVRKVIEGIARSIWTKSDAKLNVYTEKISQGLNMPCAFAECEKAERVPLLGERYFLRVYALVTVETRCENGREETECLLDDLFSAMGWIEVENMKVRGRQLKAERQKNALLIRGVYDIFVSDEEEKDFMQSISSKQE